MVIDKEADRTSDIVTAKRKELACILYSAFLSDSEAEVKTILQQFHEKKDNFVNNLLKWFESHGI
jgi:predicted CopG family antitoxin